MNIRNKFKRIKALLGLNSPRNSIKKNSVIYDNLFSKISNDEFDIISEISNTVYLPLLELEIDYKKFYFIIEGYDMAKRLKIERDAHFSVVVDRLTIRLESNCCYINTWEELLILKEIYIDGVYNYINNLCERTILIDIGMNVGFTSIYFARRSNIEHIYAYEPFLPTLNLGVENLLLNNELINKITYYNYGLGDNARNLELPYFSEFKGSLGINGIPKHVPSKENEKVAFFKVTINPICDEICKIKNNHPGHKIVAKIDCEGAEYEIITALFENNLLESIDVIMMEWHLKGSKNLVESLICSSFDVFSFNETSQTIGMLYAFKKT